MHPLSTLRWLVFWTAFFVLGAVLPANAVLYNVSAGDCATETWGGSFCYNNLDAGAGGPIGDADCSDATPHCDDDTDCSDGDYSHCSGSDLDYWSQGGTTADYATIGFLMCDDDTQIYARKGSGPFQHATIAVVCWDTSVLDDAATITEANLGLYIDQVENTDTRNLVGEWFSDDGTCDAGGSEWTKTVDPTAFTIPLSSLVQTEQNFFGLSLPDSISKTGLTCLRIGIDGVATTGNNRADFASFESLTAPGPLLFFNAVEPTSTPTITGTPTQTPTLTNTFTRTPTSTPTSTPTLSGTPTPSDTPTSTPTDTATPTITATPTDTASPTGTTTPLSTFTATATSGTPTPTLAPGCSHQTINEIPVRDSSFLTDTQNYLCDEDVERYALQFWPFVYMGGEASGNGSSLEIAPMVGFVDGGYITEPYDLSGAVSIDLSSHANQTCWVTASKLITGNIAPFTRVAGTHFLTYCGGSKPLPLPLELMWIAATTLDGSSDVDEITDLRGWSPGVRYVETSTELNQLLNIKKGQFAYVLDTGTFFVFTQDDPVTVAEWRVVATSSEALLLTGDQTVTSGVKTFVEFPRKSGEDASDFVPAATNEFATKYYVDQSFGVSLRAVADIGTLQPGQGETFLFNLPGVGTDYVCLASHTVATIGFEWFATPAGVGLVAATVTNTQSASVNPASGTLNIRCLSTD